MTNSIIINTTLRLVSFLKKSYKHSEFNKIFCKIDNFLKNCIENSKFFNLLIKPQNQKVIRNSKLYKVIINFLLIFHKYASTIKKWILSGKVVNIFKEAIIATQKSPFKVIGILGTAFIVSNISFELIVQSSNIVSISFKLIALFLFVMFTKINISLTKLLNESFFYKFFKHIISYNN